MLLLSLFVASFLAATVIPASSEVALSGAIALGEPVLVAITVASAGNILGSMTTYFIGRLGKLAWIEKIFNIDEAQIIAMQQRVARYGGLAAFFVFLPIVGELIAVTLGFMRLNALNFFLGMAIGKVARYAVWVYIHINVVEKLVFI